MPIIVFVQSKALLIGSLADVQLFLFGRFRVTAGDCFSCYGVCLGLPTWYTCLTHLNEHNRRGLRLHVVLLLKPDCLDC